MKETSFTWTFLAGKKEQGHDCSQQRKKRTESSLKAVLKWLSLPGKKIDTIVVGGTSAQPMAKAVRNVWMKLYPEEKMPRFLALGTIGHRNRLRITKSVSQKEYVDEEPGTRAKRPNKNKTSRDEDLLKRIKRDMTTTKRKKPDLEKAIRARFPKIHEARRAMILEEYVQMSTTMADLHDALKKIGIPTVFKTSFLAGEDIGVSLDLCLHEGRYRPFFYGTRREALTFETLGKLGVIEGIGFKPKAQRRTGAKEIGALRKRIRKATTLSPTRRQQLRKRLP